MRPAAAARPDPDPLAPLFAPLATLAGCTARTAPLIAKACGGDRVFDLLCHIPDQFIDRRSRVTIAAAPPGAVATLAVEVVRIDAPDRPRQPTKVVIRDASGFGELTFFGFFPRERLTPGTEILVSGKVEIDAWSGRRQVANPDRIVPAGRAADMPDVEPVWKLTAGLIGWHLRRPVAAALAILPTLPEWHGQDLLAREGFPDFASALRALHMPRTPPPPTARRRLAYDELLADRLSLARTRARSRARPGRPLTGDGSLRRRALETFTHPLTPGQVRALADIDADLAAPRRMRRLLQGDVGVGKTLVALLALLRAVEAGAQAAFMAPTEVLARQHLSVLSRLSPVPVALLTGAVKGATRRRVLDGFATGTVPIAIGTHALFQDGVAFADLGLAVIDEQHRFGVAERMSLGAKGEATDVLVMTATPIPRTLLMTQYGEMDVTRLEGRPAGRKPIRTTLHPLSALPDVADAVGRRLAEGGRVYWVCPLVSESEVSDLAAAEARFADLRRRFADTVTLAHGRQDVAVRVAALEDFAAGRRRLLVATTVIEVGVDVPEASVIVIEHAERFGLAQLHQLRGRVGRGREESFCLLLHEDGLTESMRRRLTLLRDTDDGFAIADADFSLRGGGDLLGKRQSGSPGWRIADPERDDDLLHMAGRDAAHLLTIDPQLVSERGRAALLLMRLFDRRPV